MADLSSYADEIVKIRKMEQISQQELADRVGCSQQAISRIEKKNHIPTLKSLTDLVEALGYELKIVKK